MVIPDVFPYGILKYTCFLLFITVLGSNFAVAQDTIYASDALHIQQLTGNTLVHTSYLSTQDFGKVPCNGMVVINNGEAVVYDTPVDNDVSSELIHWITTQLKCKITGVVVTHFHRDCLGGLEAFHDRQVPSYACNRTIDLVKTRGGTLPQTGFDEVIEHSLGNTKVISQYFGEGHTRDNIIGYFPDDQLIFGGCLIKSLGAGKGNLEDANTDAWSGTVSKIKKYYPEIKVVIPGHGKPGNAQLLDYTIQKFKQG